MTAETFLNFLDKHANRFHFRVLPDNADASVRPQTKHSSIANVERVLRRDNEEGGAGIFVTVNATDGEGVGGKNIVEARVLFVDLDGAPLEPVKECGLPPHCVVETSPGKYHAYWKLAPDADLDVYEAVLMGMALKFHGDTNVCDRARILRVPGFKHQKGEPFVSRIVHLDEAAEPITLEEATEHLTNGDLQVRRKEFVPVEDLIWTHGEEELRRAVSCLPCGEGERFEDRDKWIEVGLALRGATANDPGLGLELWDEMAQRGGGRASDGQLRTREYVENRWAGLSPYSLGADYIREQARLAGYDDAVLDFDPVELTAEDEFSPVDDDDTPAEPAKETRPPVDIISEVDSYYTPKLNPDWLPPPIVEFVFETARLKGVDPALVALPCLSVLSSCVRYGWTIQPKDLDFTWTEEPCLWAAVVADVSVKKSPSIKAALAPLKAVQREWMTEDSQKLKKFQTKHGIWKKKHTKYINACVDDDTLDPEAGPEEPTPPPQRRVLVDDTTIEKLAQNLLDNPSGVLQLRDELTGWFGSFDAYRSGTLKGTSKDRAFWLEAYQGGSKEIDRVGRGTTVVPNLKVSIVGGIQPDKLQEIADLLDADGLIQRFLPVYVERRGRDIDALPSPGLSAGYEFVVRGLLDMELTEKVAIRLSPEAQIEREIINSIAEDEVADPTSVAAFRGHMGKWEAAFMRLMLVYHMVDCTAKNLDAANTLVSGKVAHRVRMLFNYFFFPHAVRFYKEFFGTSQVMKDAEGVVRLILAKGWREVTMRDLKAGYRHNSMEPKKNPHAWVHVMDKLYSLGWVEPKNPDWVRLTDVKRWTVNPLAFELYDRVAQEERIRREEEHKLIQRNKLRRMKLMDELRAVE
jgi:hypothetical protein